MVGYDNEQLMALRWDPRDRVDNVVITRVFTGKAAAGGAKDEARANENLDLAKRTDYFREVHHYDNHIRVSPTYNMSPNYFFQQASASSTTTS